jgi:hypothetical protein
MSPGTDVASVVRETYRSVVALSLSGDIQPRSVEICDACV